MDRLNIDFPIVEKSTKLKSGKTKIADQINGILSVQSELESYISSDPEEVKRIKNIVNQLPKAADKKDISEDEKKLYIYDLDDALYSRTQALQKMPGLGKNRGDYGHLWILGYYSGVFRKYFGDDYNEKINNTELSNQENKYLLDAIDTLTPKQEELAISAFIDEYYSTDSDGEKKPGLVRNFSKNIKNIRKGKKNHVILTAGPQKFQEAKAIKLGLMGNDANTAMLVEDAKSKPSMIIYKVLELGYIPEEIHIYDDRQWNFLNQGQELADLLGTKIVLHNMAINQHNKVEETPISLQALAKVQEGKGSFDFGKEFIFEGK